MSGWRCKEEGCGGTRLESDAAGGSTYCSTCGAVYDENTLVNSVEFSESAGGAAAVVGTFVSAAGTKAYPLAAGSRGMAGDRDSREASIQAAHGKIKMIATQLRMSLKYAEAAHRLFRAAVTNRFVQGRKTVNVIAACLFIVARQNRLPMMLLDISDAVRVNVFELGQTFLRLFRILSLQTNMHIVDPSLLINKYVERLNLGVKKNVIQEVAANITAQMNRDWIHTGRRPAGICAVALQIACNVHGVGITRKQICRILRISDSTISKRMREFEQTPASLMAVEYFRRGGGAPQQFDRAKGDRGAMPEADPPSFVNNRAKDGTLERIMQAAPPSSEAASAGGGGSSAQADADADAEAALDAALASSEEGEDESSSDDDNSVVSDTKKSQRSTGSAQKRKRRARPGGSAGGGAAAEKRTLRARAGGGGVRDISDNESVYSGETSEASNEVDSDDDDSSEEEEGRVKAGDKGKGSGGDKEKGKGKGKAASKGKGKAKAKKRKAKRAKREPPHYEDLDPDDPYAALKHLIGRRVHFETARRPSSRHVERQREAEDMLVELEGEIEEGLLQARAEPAPKALPEIDVSEPVHVEVQVSPEETKAKDAAQALAEKAAEMAQKAAHAAGGRRAMRVGAHKFVQGHGALGGEEIVEGVIGDSAQPGDTFEFQKPQPRPPSGQMGGAAAGAAGGGGGAARKVFVMPLSNTLTEEQHQAEYEKDKKAQADLAAHLKQFLEKENDSGADHNDNGSGDESEEDDAFLREHVLPEKERNNKKRMWSERNKDWLDTQERKAREAAQGGGHKPTRKQKKNAVKEGATAADAVMQVSKAKKLSTKINYQVVAQGLNFTGAPEPEAAEEAAVKEPILPMFEMEEEEGGGGAAAAPVRKRQRITIQGTGNISQSITHPAPPAPMETEEGVEGGEAEDEVEDEVEAEGGDDLAARYDDVALAKAQLEGGFDDNYRSDDEDDEYY